MRLVEGARQRLRYHPTRKLASVLVLLSPIWLLTAFDSGWWLAGAGALGILLVAVIGDALALPAARDLSVVRDLPPTVGVGDSVEGEVRVTGRWDAPLRLRMYDQLPVSRNEQIKSKLLEAAPPPTEQTDLNILKWELSLTPQQKQEIDFSFQVEQPRDMKITGIEV